MRPAVRLRVWAGIMCRHRARQPATANPTGDLPAEDGVGRRLRSPTGAQLCGAIVKDGGRHGCRS
jgi:hypothetical protein